MIEKIDIVILTKDEIDFTKQCLRSLKTNTKLEFRLIQVDNASVDQTLEWVYNFCYSNEIELLQIKNKVNHWVYTSINQGLKASDSELIVVINNDIIFAPLAIDNLIKELKKSNSLLVYPSFTRKKLPKNFPKNTEREHKGIPLFCFAIKRKAFRIIGYFDEKFKLARGDIDYIKRLTCSGYSPKEVLDSYVHHFESKTLKKITGWKNIANSDKQYYYGRRVRKS